MSNQTNEDTLKNELLTVKEVAAYLRVGRVTVWRWCQQGTIPASRVGRSWRIRRDELLSLLEISQFPNSEATQLDSTSEANSGNGSTSDGGPGVF